MVLDNGRHHLEPRDGADLLEEVWVLTRLHRSELRRIIECANNTHIQESVFSLCFLRVASRGAETKSDNQRTAKKLLALYIDTFRFAIFWRAEVAHRQGLRNA